MRAGSAGPWWRRVRRGPIGLLAVVAVAGCGGGTASGTGVADSAFLSAVHLNAPDIASYRTDVQLTRLGHASCDGFRGGASFQQLADRLVLLEGTNPLPSADLGAVIDAAVQAYCPQFQDRVG